jgi:RHS repeat-associated protein
MRMALKIASYGRSGWVLPGLRKACHCQSRWQVPRTQCPRRNPQTCFEGPFGELINATGPMAIANPFRFSTKYQDDETGLPYYGYRYYIPTIGSWPNRDPIGEEGLINLYAYVANDPIIEVDLLGLQCCLLEVPPILLEPPPVVPPEEIILPRAPVGIPLPRVPDVSYPRGGPFPPEGTIENPFRPASFGRIRPDTGRFQECWRYDKADPVKPGWEGLDHFHYWGGPQHMTQPLPPFHWFNIPVSINPVNAPPVNITVPPGTPVPPALIPPPAPSPSRYRRYIPVYTMPTYT